MASDAAFDQLVFDDVTFEAGLSGGGTVTADAIIFKTQTGETNANLRFTIDAWVSPVATIYQAPVEVLLLPDDADVRVYQTPTEVLLTPDNASAIVSQVVVEVPAQASDPIAIASQVAVEVLIRPAVLGTLTAAAIIFRVQQNSASLDAIVKGDNIESSVTADALLMALRESSFTIEAWIPGDFLTVEDDFAADAIISGEQQDARTADAIISGERQDSRTADAIISGERQDSLSVEAIVRRAISGSITADSVAMLTRVSFGEMVRALSPLVWFRLNEFDGAFIDSGSSAQNAAVTGSPTRYASGKVDDDAGVTFAGGQYGTTASFVLSIGNVFTFEAWIYPTGTGRKTIWSGSNATNMFQLEVGGNGTDRLSAIVNGTFVGETANGAITRNQWNHVVYQRTGTGAGTQKFWVNGVSVAVAVDNGASVAYANTQTVKYVGARVGASQEFTGTIDEIVIYGSVLSQSEIIRHYVAGSHQMGLPARAIAMRTAGQSVTADAEITLYTQVLGSFTAAAVTQRIQSSSKTANAIIRSPRESSKTADAEIIFQRVLASLTANAVIYRVMSGSKTANAIVLSTQERTFAADAEIIFQRVTDSLTANAIVMPRFQASAIVLANQLGSRVADAIVRKLGITGSLSADSVVMPRFMANAIILRTMEGSKSASAWIYAPRQDPGGPGEPGETPLISVMYDGVDITDHVMIEGATFTMQVNGTPGQFSFLVRDDDHSLDFTSGAEVTVDIDGRRKFGGYATSIKRKFFFDVENTTTPTDVSRMWLIEGVDYNILFSKRVVRDKVTPKNVELREWAAGSRDDTIIKYIFDHYTDLAGDGATYNGVTHIGSPNPDKNGVVGSGGLRFGDCMSEINRLIGGVYYFDQFKDLNYVDVDTPTATYGMSDRPVNGEVGYRELLQIENGAKLANDALVWGAGLGSRNLRFSRSQNSASINAHGRWQYGEFTTTMYKQASVDERASTVVYGTDQNKRGGKDDQESWTVVTYEQSFSVGQKVQIESEVFGKSDVVPIRRCTLSFETKVKPKYLLTLSHEIDLPWSTFEMRIPKFQYPKPEVDSGCSTCMPEETGGGCTAEACGITDTFDRVVSAGWGVADAGYTYELVKGTDDVVSVNNGAGYILAWTWSAGIGGYSPVSLATDINLGYSSGSMKFTPGSYSVGGDSDSTLRVLIGKGTSISLITGGNLVRITRGATTSTTSFSFTEQIYNVRWVNAAADCQVWVWAESGSEPASPTVTNSGAVGAVDTLEFIVPVSTSWSEFSIHNLDIDGVTRCSAAQFDTFSRVVPNNSGWGVGENGERWQYANNSGTALFGVDKGVGYFQSSGTSERNAYWNWDEMVSAPWWYWGPNWSNPDVHRPCTMYIRFRFTSLPTLGYATVLFQPGDEQWTIRVGINGAGGYGYIFWNDVEVTWQANQWYIAEWRFDPAGWPFMVDGYGPYTQYQAMSIYKEGEQPNTWLVTSDTAMVEGDWAVTGSTPGDSTMPFSFYSNVSGGTFRVEVDSIDFDYAGKQCYTCYSGGGSAIVDSFTRTASNTWGDAEAPFNEVSQSGPSWLRVLKGSWTAAKFSVDGSAAINDGTGISASGNSGWSVIPLANQSWDQTITFKMKYTGTWTSLQVALNNAQDPFAATVSCAFDSAVSGGVINVFADPAGSGTLTYGDGTEPTATTNVWYYVKVETTAKSINIKIWKTTDSEPGDWTSWGTYTVDATAPPQFFSIGIYGGMKLWIDDLQIASGSGACSTSGSVIDDWGNRTVALTAVTTNDSLSPWAGTSGTSDPWYVGGQWNPGSPSDVWMGVESGTGRVRLTKAGPSGGSVASIATLNEGGSDYGPWATTGAGAPDSLFTGTETMFSIDFMCDDWYKSYLEICLADVVTRDIGGWDIYIAGNGWAAQYSNYWNLNGWEAHGPDVPFTPQNGTWYTYKASVSGNSISAKVWERGTTEPSTWQTPIYTTAMPWIPGEFTMMMGNYDTSSPGSYVNFYFDNFVQYSRTNAPEPGGAGASTGGDGRTAASGTGAQTVFSVGGAYVPGTTKVFINGYLQRPGIEYYETSPSAGTITFVSAPAAGADVDIFYESFGVAY